MDANREPNRDYLIGLGAEGALPLPLCVFEPLMGGRFLKRTGFDVTAPSGQNPDKVIKVYKPSDYEKLIPALSNLKNEIVDGVMLSGHNRETAKHQIDAIDVLGSWLARRLQQKENVVVKLFPLEDFRNKPEPPASTVDGASS